MKPSEFFVGAMDFFAILLPGALFAYLLVPWVPQVFGPVLPRLESKDSEWVAFGVAAYFFGHLLHHAGSVLDHAYDEVFVPRQRRFGDELLFVRAKELVRADLGDDLRDINVFQWAGSYVRAKNAVAGAELERAGADSKFFRSICLLGCLAAAIFVFRGQALAAGGAVALAVFSYRRFCHQRWASAQRTYQYFVLLKGEETDQAASKMTA